MKYRGYIIEEMDTEETENRLWHILKNGEPITNMFESPQQAQDWIDEELAD